MEASRMANTNANSNGDSESLQDTLVFIQSGQPIPNSPFARRHSPSIESAPSSRNSTRVPSHRLPSPETEPVGPTGPISYEYLEWTTLLPEGVPPHIQAITDPFAWGRARKNVTLFMSCFSTFVAAYVAGAYTAGMDGMQADFGVSKEALLGGLALFTGGFAVAPMFLAPLSEVYGRRPVFIATLALACACHLGTALCQDFAGLMLGRFFLGVGTSTFSTMVGGVISDIYHAEDRSFPMSLFTTTAIGGTGIGPVISAFINRDLGWRWIHWFQLILNLLVLLLLSLAMKETRGNVLMTRKAYMLNEWLDQREGNFQDVDMKTPQKKVRWKVRADESKESLATLMKMSLTRPFHLLFTEPVVFWFSMWTAFAWGVLYLFLESIPIMFEAIYHFDKVQIGMIFLSLVVGCLLANISNYLLEQLANIYLPLPAPPTPADPERRLYSSCIVSILLPIGMFLYGWTAYPRFHYLIPTLGITCATMGIYSIYLAVFNYFADTYQRYASSALAAQSFCRNMMAAGFPLFTEAMFTGLGFGAASSLLGGVAMVLTVVPWVLIFYGGRIRARSKFAKALH
ncbi:major facilitator superfamily domain-containing protein [Peziza echinospora]|nr:major facilitator superfamily domain-containing protein [Peziza echinospora]